MSQFTIQEDIVARHRSIIRKMDLYHQGKLSWEEYKQIPEEELQAARDWQQAQTNQSLKEAYRDLGQELDP